MAAWQFWTLVACQLLIAATVWLAANGIYGIINALSANNMSRLDVMHQESVGILLDLPEKIANEVDSRLDQQVRSAEIRKNIRPYD